MNRKLLLLVLTLVMLGSFLQAQEILRIGGLNEASYVYRTVPDSLNSYFRNSFNFNLNYRNFGFGMSFVAELPKYSTEQSQLLEDISSAELKLGWQEIYAYYQKEAFKIHAGTINETMSSGLTFRSWEDIEFDQDNRIDGFLVSYDQDARIKALYGAIPNPNNKDKYDLAYGAYAEYPLFSFLRLGGTALSFRNFSYVNPLTQRDIYDQRDVISGRMGFSKWDLDASVEYAHSELYYPNTPGLTKGSAIYATADYFFHPFQIGSAYKRYENFSYRLHDLPLANHHGETLADNQSSGVDEEGLQGWLNWEITDQISYKLDYAEAWSRNKEKKMNDFYTGLDWFTGQNLIAVEYGQIEKIDDSTSNWQIERIPSITTSLSVWGQPISLKTEYKHVEKQHFETLKSHWEPGLQADLKLGKMSLSMGLKTEWKDPSELMDSSYFANLEAKYPVLEHSELTLFVGKDSGGKVCRNGICRYVAPFNGIKAEFTTRF